MKLLLALIVTGFFIGLKRYFPAEAVTLVDKRGNAHFGDTMVTKTKQAYNEKKRCGANGNGNNRLKVLYQNGGNVIHTFGMI